MITKKNPIPPKKKRVVSSKNSLKIMFDQCSKNASTALFKHAANLCSISYRLYNIDFIFFKGAIPAYSEDFQRIFKFANF